jgi:hypothetical protein
MGIDHGGDVEVNGQFLDQFVDTIQRIYLDVYYFPFHQIVILRILF